VNPHSLKVCEEKAWHLTNVRSVEACLGLGFLGTELGIHLDFNQRISPKGRVEEVRVEGLKRLGSSVVHDTLALTLGNQRHKRGGVIIGEDISAEPDRPGLWWLCRWLIDRLIALQEVIAAVKTGWCTALVILTLKTVIRTTSAVVGRALIDVVAAQAVFTGRVALIAATEGLTIVRVAGSVIAAVNLLAELRWGGFTGFIVAAAGANQEERKR
jgi:hypothetical protein